MSYTIIYDKQFVKVNDKFIPILYWGSNNCYDYSNTGRGIGRRSRSWENYKYGLNSLAHTKDELLAICEAYKKGLIAENNETLKRHADWNVYDDKSFGYFAGLAIKGSTHKTTYGMFKGIFTTGMKNALTVEELKKFGVSINIQTSSYNKEQLDKLGLSEIYKHVNTTDELINMIETLKSYPFESYYISLYASEDTMKRIRRINKLNQPRKERKTKTVTTGYSFKFESGYFLKGIKYGFKYTFFAEDAKKVYNEKTALRILKKLNAKYSKEFTLHTFTLDKPKEIFV